MLVCEELSVFLNAIFQANVQQLLIGNDVPGSTVTLHVAKGGIKVDLQQHLLKPTNRSHFTAIISKMVSSGGVC